MGSPEEYEERRKKMLEERRKRIEEYKKTDELKERERNLEEQKRETIEDKKQAIKALIEKNKNNQTQTVALLSNGLKAELRHGKITPQQYEELRNIVIQEMKKNGYEERIIKQFERSAPLLARQ
jgi:hypothetical protein